MARAELSHEEAYCVLEPYFIAARKVFVQFCDELGLEGKLVAKTQFECTAEMHNSERHFAGTTLDGRKVLVAPQMADLPEDTVSAIFAHEFGHVVDHRFPAQFILVQDELIFVGDVDSSDARGAQTRVARMKQWEKRNEDEVEFIADALAAQATGCSIGYSGRCMLQGLNRGVARPAGLR